MTQKPWKHILLLCLCALFTTTSMGLAKRIDLSTLPGRDSVQLTIYNSEDLTLVKETRTMTFKRGNNRLQFSWSGTLIDPTSVSLRPLAHKDQIQVVDTTFPGDKPKHLIWNVQSTYEGQVRVEVSYFTSGLTWKMDYVAITDANEKTMSFKGYVRVFNRSGETYPNAQVRLIVGKINLVEKIAVLARRSGVVNLKKISPPAYDSYRKRAARYYFGRAARVAEGASARPKKILKEGLSEYFMFSIEGSETLRHGWSKRLQAVKASVKEYDILYRMRAHQYGAQPARFYIWQNASKYRLGKSPLPNGQLRIYKKNPKGALTFLGEKKLRYVPVKGPIEVNLGHDPLVRFVNAKLHTKRLNFTFRRSHYSEYVSGWDTHSQVAFSIQNDRAKSIRVELQQRWYGDVSVTCRWPGKAVDYRTIEWKMEVPAHTKRSLKTLTIKKHGSRQKQHRVQLLPISSP